MRTLGEDDRGWRGRRQAGRQAGAERGYPAGLRCLARPAGRPATAGQRTGQPCASPGSTQHAKLGQLLARAQLQPPAHLARLRQPDWSLMSEAVVGFCQHADGCIGCHKLPECRVQGHQRAGGRAVGLEGGRRCVVLRAGRAGKPGYVGPWECGSRPWPARPLSEAKAAACSASTFTICKVCQPRKVQLRPVNVQNDRGLAACRGTRLSTNLSERARLDGHSNQCLHHSGAAQFPSSSVPLATSSGRRQLMPASQVLSETKENPSREVFGGKGGQMRQARWQREAPWRPWRERPHGPGLACSS